MPDDHERGDEDQAEVDTSGGEAGDTGELDEDGRPTGVADGTKG